MSLKRIPGFGKSGTSRTARRRDSVPGVDALLAVGTLPHDGERSWKVVQTVERQVVDSVDAGSKRPGASVGQEFRDRLIGPGGGDFDPAVIAVPDPSGEVQAASCLAHEPPKPYALNLPDDLDVNRRHPSSAAARPSQECREHRRE